MLTHLLLQSTPLQSATEQAHQNDIKGNCRSQKPNFALIQDKENSQVWPPRIEKVKYIYIYHLLVSVTNYNTVFSPKWQYNFSVAYSKANVIHTFLAHLTVDPQTTADWYILRKTPQIPQKKKKNQEICKAYKKLERKLLKLCSFFSVYQA